MKRFTTNELNCMLHFFKTNLPDEKRYEPLIDLLYYSINLEYRSLSIENLGVIYSIEKAFHDNIEGFSEIAQESFFHEYGHLYEALLRHFRFESIHIFDHDVEHIFYRKFYSSYKIAYTCKRKPIINVKHSSYSLFSKRFATDDDLRMVALGGFKQDFVRASKTTGNILKSFGLTDKFEVIDNSDASYILFQEQKGKTKYMFINQS
ncbi:hypothetical protein [Enterococcus sp. AZ179]|uniref:hypothetical protein n=1 Tax=Enterococcus sp. AZ179 TaxID=2774680 RepID=UPI003D28199C